MKTLFFSKNPPVPFLLKKGTEEKSLKIEFCLFVLFLFLIKKG